MDNDVADVVVVGFGAAGACAAIEAVNAGADVLLIDRFSGGGATALRGGVSYAGGGTTPCPYKTSYPNNGFYPYCSGSEASGGFRDAAHLDRVSAWRFITPSSAFLGGLIGDGTGAVRRPDDTAAAGLCAAGRSAVGICSRSYISGFSLVDCVFSGRRAGRYSAAAGVSRRRR